MNTEQLQMILQTLQGLGADTKDVFILWLVIDKAAPVILGLALVLAGVYLARRALDSVACSKWVEEVRDRLGIGCAGYVTQRELDEVRKHVNKLLDKEGPKK